MGNVGGGSMADKEFVKADKMVADFLGIEWGHLCPRFGYNHNEQWLLVFEAVVSFAIFQLVLYAAWRMSGRSGLLAGTVPLSRADDPTLQELDQFSSMVDTQLSSLTQTEQNSLATFTTNQHLYSSEMSSAMGSGKRLQRPDDLAKLKEEFHQKITQVKAKWKDDPDAPENAEEETDENNIFHNTALLIAVYWSVQAIMSYVVLCSVGISMIGMPDRGVWQHYCLLLYAVSNCGILPSGGQAFAFLVDWWQYEALTTMPASYSTPPESSYRALQSVPTSPTGLPELAGPFPPRSASYAAIDKDMQRRQSEVNEMKWKFVLMCLPQIVPVAFMLVTHTIPFLFAYLWLTLIAALVTYLFVALAKIIVRRTSKDPRQRILRQAKVLAFVFQLVTTLYIHASVQVMTRVYAGEWRHGGYFDSLWLHLLVDDGGGWFSDCPWFSIVRLIDAPLRWT
jgi:hypothetical protein